VIKLFNFKRIIFEKDALNYKMAERILELGKQEGKEIIFLKGNRYISPKGMEKKEKYIYGKETLIVGTRKTLKFQTCKPSAHYQLPLVSGCIGQCEYCYLNTQFSDRPYVYVYVNIDDILKQAKKHIDDREEITIFEGAATSDPLPVEHYSNSLKQAIEFFAKEEKGRFRFVTKYTNIDGLLNINHSNHTEIRLSVNIPSVIKEFEHKTPSFEKRVEALNKLLNAGYPVGVIIAPIILRKDWKKDYGVLLNELSNSLDVKEHPLTFELISHRFTTRAKNTIMEIYKDTKLPMNEEERKYKYGQFGYGKYVYTKEQMDELKEFFQDKINEMQFDKQIKYII
jgi:spore photoproduct lyase